jgi:hypothetical protein
VESSFPGHDYGTREAEQGTENEDDLEQELQAGVWISRSTITIFFFFKNLKSKKELSGTLLSRFYKPHAFHTLSHPKKKRCFQ